MSNTNDVLIESIRKRLENGETKRALVELDQLTSNSSSTVKSEVSLLTARFHRLTRDYRQQLITREEYGRDQARLDRDLLAFLEEIQEDSINGLITNIMSSPLIEIPGDSALEKIIGADNLQQISWIACGLEQARAVCRIITPEGKGTGFQIASGVVMTNHHVIGSEEVAEKSVAEFNYELDVQGNKLQSHRYRLSPDEFQSNPLLDYAFVRMIPDPSLPGFDDWGVVYLNPHTVPVIGEHVTIIQHPGGRRKQIALTANQIVNVDGDTLHYITDTMRGSSGSPVFNDDWEVIAIHHAYGGPKQDGKGVLRDVNEGILIGAIRKDAGRFWPM